MLFPDLQEFHDECRDILVTPERFNRSVIGHTGKSTEPKGEVVSRITPRMRVGGEASINIYGEVGWDIQPNVVMRAIQDIDAETIRVNINSPGGSLFGGLGIANALREHPARVVVVNQAMAGSVASVIFMVGDERIMMAGSELVIHRSHATFLVSGNEGELADEIKAIESLRERLKVYDQNIAALIAEKSGGDKDKIYAQLKAETRFTEKAAVEQGYATGGDPVTAKAGNKDKPKAEDKEPEPEDKVEAKPEVVATESMDAEFADDYFPLDKLRGERLDLDVLAP